MSFNSRGQHLWLNKNLISTILTICVPIFHVFIHNLDKLTGQDFTKHDDFYVILYRFCIYNLCKSCGIPYDKHNMQCILP